MSDIPRQRISKEELESSLSSALSLSLGLGRESDSPSSTSGYQPRTRIARTTSSRDVGHVPPWQHSRVQQPHRSPSRAPSAPPRAAAHSFSGHLPSTRQLTQKTAAGNAANLKALQATRATYAGKHKRTSYDSMSSYTNARPTISHHARGEVVSRDSPSSLASRKAPPTASPTRSSMRASRPLGTSSHSQNSSQNSASTRAEKLEILKVSARRPSLPRTSSRLSRQSFLSSSSSDSDGGSDSDNKQGSGAAVEVEVSGRQVREVAERLLDPSKISAGAPISSAASSAGGVLVGHHTDENGNDGHRRTGLPSVISPQRTPLLSPRLSPRLPPSVHPSCAALQVHSGGLRKHDTYASSALHHIPLSLAQQAIQKLETDWIPTVGGVGNCSHFTLLAFGGFGGCVGLRNLGNTCFMNSVLQCLNAVAEFVAAVLSSQTGGLCDEDRGLGAAAAFADLLHMIWTAVPGSAVSPNRLVASLAKNDERWGEGEQQDAQEFLHSFLEMLQMDLSPEPSTPLGPRRSSVSLSESQQASEAWQRVRQLHASPVDAFFGGLLQSTVCCAVCKRISHSFEYFLDLSLPLPSQRPKLTLQDCLTGFTAVEQLPASEGYFCEGCKKCQAVSKQLRIAHLPPVLILHLKRFSASTSFFSRLATFTKDSSPVELQADCLDVGLCCNDDCLANQVPVYDLVSVCHHSGSMGGGHYTAEARVEASGDDVWLEFNDSLVKPVLPATEASRTAYMLFYRMREEPA